MNNKKQNTDGALVMVAVLAVAVVAVALVVLTQACAVLPGAILGLQAHI